MSTSSNRIEQNTTLPTFTSVHDQPSKRSSRAESSNASSSRSAVGRSQGQSQTHSDDGSQSKESPTGTGDGAAQDGKKTGIAHGPIRRFKRSSGGFLLDPSPLSSRRPLSLLSSPSGKGKHKDEAPNLRVPKSRDQPGEAASRSSYRGSSPLSSEALATSQHERGGSANTAAQENEAPNTAGSLRGNQSGSPWRQNTSYGFDTDPAQIVEMALRLNEARQRQTSMKRFPSSTTEGRRAISAATSIVARSSPPQGSLHAARVRKPFAPGPAAPQETTRGLSSEMDRSSPNMIQATSPEADQDLDDDMNISRATQNRVAKAKQYFELAYLHRRLLSHLPPLRRPDVEYDPSKPGYDSKVYNPLQYARNRKLRFRERAPINSEAEGWHDVQKVSAWVDAVVSSHQAVKHDPRECIRLPQLNLHDDEPREDDSDDKAASRRQEATGRPRRPKSDWVTHPGDLIADAFWTEQGLNKQKIYDRDNEPIFPSGTKFHFSGWRNRTPINVPEELRQTPSSPDTSPELSTAQQVSPQPTLPTFESAHKDHGWARTRSKFTKAIKKASTGRQKGDGDIFDTSSDPSDSGAASGSEKRARGSERLSRRRERLRLPDGDPFGPLEPGLKQNQKVRSGEAESAGHDSNRSSRHDSLDHASLLKYLRRNSTTLSTGSAEADGQKPDKRSKFIQSLKLDAEDRRPSSFENESTGPGTPAENGFPSIAISLSPPESRAASPTRRGKSNFLEIVKDKVQPHRDPSDRTDFITRQDSAQSSKRGSFARIKEMSADGSRSHSPMSRGTSPFTRQQTQQAVDETSVASMEPRGSTISKISTRTADSDRTRSHRVRGMFKGGRIAEIVGNEVSRVGDFIWKREPPRNAGTDSGSTSGYESDSDDFVDHRSAANRKQDKKPSSPHPVVGAKDTTPVSAGRKSASPKENPQFHIQGLPTFTSPFQRDKEAQERKQLPQSPGGTPQQDQGREYDSDPVSSAAAARRAAGRSPRFDRLQPPKLDIRAATPNERRNSYGFGAALDLTRTKSASELYNKAINGEPPEPPTGRRMNTAAFGSSHDLTRMLSGDGGSRSQTRKRVTMRDLIRTRALLLATTIKATNVSAYCEQIPRPQSSFLFAAFQTTGASGSEVNEQLPVRRKDEHVVAARHLIHHLNKHGATFSDNLSNFTSNMTQFLHREVQILEDTTDKSLFPRLQTLSDQTGQLAQKLTTTSTLAVRSINDEVNEAMKMKRRGPFRFSRAVGYKLIEWAVVSILWLIWFNVTIIRGIIGTVKAIWAFLAWLFFLR